MRSDADIDISDSDRSEIYESLLRGVVSRASIVSFIYAIVFTGYAFTSLEFLQKYKPELTLFGNLWPRLILNTSPFLAIAFLCRNYKTHVHLKAWIWTLGLPVLFSAACLIHVWPLIWSGSPQIYIYVHSANLFIISSSLIIVSMPPRFLFAQTAAFVALFFIPLAFLFLRVHELVLLKWCLGELIMGLSASIYASLIVFQLRQRIARFDHYMKKTAGSFLGSALSEAIYEQKSELLKNRRVEAMIVKMDIRGYTEFYKKNDAALVRQFMSAYHGIVSRYVGETAGYWHKSIGDGQLASYGAMGSDVDLSDIPGIENEMASANKRRNAIHFENVLKAVTSITHQFERLKEKYDIQENLSLGIAVAYGEVEIRVQGDDDHKKELDIDGEVILRCSRLEAYTKVIQKELGTEASIVILSPELIPVADARMFRVWETTARPDLQVRSFPEISKIAFHVFRDADERRDFVLKLRSS